MLSNVYMECIQNTLINVLITLWALPLGNSCILYMYMYTQQGDIR